MAVALVVLGISLLISIGAHGVLGSAIGIWAATLRRLLSATASWCEVSPKNRWKDDALVLTVARASLWRGCGARWVATK